LNKKEFWDLINQSKSHSEEQAEWLVTTLSQKSLEDILDFEFFFQNYMNESYQSSLWGAAYLIMGGCSDDAFDYFRGWLISQGKEAYDQTIANHEYLAEYISEDKLGSEGFPENEEMLSVSFDAYCLKQNGNTEWDEKLYDEMQNKLESSRRIQPTSEIEFDWEDEEDLAEMFPVLWKKFGEESNTSCKWL
jgi:hypothetical protein